MKDDKPLQHHHLQPQQISNSDEIDNSPRSSKGKKDHTGGDEPANEVSKRPRGRPPGSKNKPKRPALVTGEAESSAGMKPHVLEIPRGHDIVDSLGRFCQRRNIGVCILSGAGAVANVTLRQPHLGGAAAPPGAPTAVLFRGRFEILSLSATFLPPAMAAALSAAVGRLAISLAGSQGQIVGGTVEGPLVTAGTVVVVAAAFSDPTIHLLPVEDAGASVSGACCGGDPEGHERSIDNQRQEEGRELQRRQQGQGATAEEMRGGMYLYRGQVPPNIIWGSAARKPPPPPY